jgi:solute:Na+ symporter, SSS family
LALLGLQAAPSFAMVAMSARDARGFAPQQVWAGSVLVGFVTLVFVVGEGLVGRMLAIPGVTADSLHSHMLRLLALDHPALSALLAVGLIATVQFTAAACVWTTSAMLAQDVCQRYFATRADDRQLRVYARTAMAVIFVVALGMGTFTPVAQAQLGTLALGFALQLWPAWAGLTRIRWISPAGVNVGLSFGIVAVVLTENVGGSIARFFGLELPWGRWPWTIHSAGWGIFVNLLFCYLVSIVSSRTDARSHRDGFHDAMAQYDALTPRRNVMRPAVWALMIVWFFFALGPGAVLGAKLLVTVGAAEATQLAAAAVPSLWLWQMLWWACGAFLGWWLAYKLELATPPRTRAEVERDSARVEASFFSEREHRRAGTRSLTGQRSVASRAESTGTQ